MKARAVHKKGKMNRLEAAYAQHLQSQVLTGAIDAWFFESLKFKLAENACGYTPDFMVVRADGVIEFHEVKGHWEDDARVKIKVAADKFPFVFYGVTRVKNKVGGRVWRLEAFTNVEPCQTE